MVSRIGQGGSNWDMQFHLELQRQQASRQAEEIQRQQATQQAEEVQRQQQEQSATQTQPDDWARIQQEFQERQVQFQFDPNQDYQWQLDQNNELISQQLNFNVSASMTKALYDNVINSVEELMKNSLVQEEQLKANTDNQANRQQDITADWQMQIVQEVIRLNAANITELAAAEEAQQAAAATSRRTATQPARPVEQTNQAQNNRALRIDDPRQRFANMMPLNRQAAEPRPVDQTQRTTVTDNRQNMSLDFDLRTRMMMGQQRLAAASVGGVAPQQAPRPQPLSQTQGAQQSQQAQREQQARQAQQAQTDNVTMSQEYAKKTVSEFSAYMAQAAQFGCSMDINALVQYAIREAYIDGIQDLVFQRDKVQYNIECKKCVREALNDARNALTSARTKASNDLKATYQQWEDTTVNAAKEAMGAAKWSGPLIDENELEWFYQLAQAEKNIASGNATKEDNKLISFRSGAFLGKTQISNNIFKKKINNSEDFNQSGQYAITSQPGVSPMEIKVIVKDTKNVPGINTEERTYYLSIDTNNLSKENFVSQAKKQLPTYEDLWRENHHPEPDAAHAMEYVDQKAEEYIAGYQPMTLDQSRNPPEMVKDNNMKINNSDDLDKYIENLEGKLASLGDDAQLANTDLQNVMQKQQQLITMMSNISKLLNDTAMAVIRHLN